MFSCDLGQVWKLWNSRGVILRNLQASLFSKAARVHITVKNLNRPQRPGLCAMVKVSPNCLVLFFEMRVKLNQKSEAETSPKIHSNQPKIEKFSQQGYVILCVTRCLAFIVVSTRYSLVKTGSYEFILCLKIRLSPSVKC